MSGKKDKNPPKLSAEDYRKRDEKLLAFIARYRLATFLPLSILFFGGPKHRSGQAATRLEKKGLVKVHTRKAGFPGGYSFVSLAAKGAKAIGAKQSRCTQLIGSGLDFALQVLLFCVMPESGKRRYRAEVADAGAVLQKAKLPTNVPFLVTREDDHPAVLRCYQAIGPVKKTVAAIRKLISEAEDDDELRDAMRAKDYGFAVLCPTSQSRDVVRRSLLRTEFEHVRIVVEFAADGEHLKTFTKKRPNKYR